jgi:hypothetical protein
MQSVPIIGIDLPLKALVWQDEAGVTWLSNNDPGWLAKRHRVSHNCPRASRSAGRTGMMSNPEDLRFGQSARIRKTVIMLATIGAFRAWPQPRRNHYFFREKKFLNAAIASGEHIRSPKK